MIYLYYQISVDGKPYKTVNESESNMYNVTRANDLLTNHILTLIREYEFDNDTNVDATVYYGHYANEINFGVCDKHGEPIKMVIDGNQTINELTDILYSVIQ